MPVLLAALFALEELALALRSPAIAARLAVFTDHPMAGNHQRHSIAGTGASYGAHRAGPANATCNFAVRTGTAVGDFFKGMPHLPLKRSRLNVQRQIKVRSLAVEVLEDRANRTFQ